MILSNDITTTTFTTLRDSMLVSYYKYINEHEEAYIHTFVELLQVVDKTYLRKVDSSVWYGLGGIAYILNELDICKHLKAQIEEKMYMDSITLISDFTLYKGYKTYDIFSGFSGRIKYLLYSDIQKRKKQELLDLVCEALLNQDFMKLFYQNINDYVDNIAKYQCYPNGYLDISISHGLMSVLEILCDAKSLGFYSTYLDDCIMKMYYFMTSYNITMHDKTLFINLSGGNKDVERAILHQNHWCCGHLGVLHALYKYKENFHSIVTDQIKKNMEQFIDCLPNELEDENLFLCHGMAGSILLLNSVSNLLEEDKRKIILTNKIKHYVKTFKQKQKNAAYHTVCNFANPDSIIDGRMSVYILDDILKCPSEKNILLHMLFI